MSLNRFPTTPTPYSLDARCALPVTRRAGQRRGRRATHGAPANSWRRAPRPPARAQRRSRRADPSAPRPNNNEPARSPTSSAAASPIGTPTTTIQPTCFSTMRRTACRLRAKREPQADLARAVRDHVRKDAVKADAPPATSRGSRATPRKRHEQPIRPARCGAPANRTVRGSMTGNAGIDARHESRHGGEQAFRRLGRPHVERGTEPEIARLAARHDDLSHERLLDAVVGRVANETDDLDVGRRASVKADAPADRVVAEPEALREALVDYRDPRRAEGVGRA